MTNDRTNVTVMLGSIEESDIIVKEEDAIEQISVSIGPVLVLWFNTKDEVEVLRAALQEYLEHPTCEMCDKRSTQIASDELGNDMHVCDDHAEQLAARTPERQADEWYDQNHKSGD